MACKSQGHVRHVIYQTLVQNKRSQSISLFVESFELSFLVIKQEAVRLNWENISQNVLLTISLPPNFVLMTRTSQTLNTSL